MAQLSIVWAFHFLLLLPPSPPPVVVIVVFCFLFCRFDLVRFGLLWTSVSCYFAALLLAVFLSAMLQHSIAKTRDPKNAEPVLPYEKEQTRFPQATDFGCSCCCRLMKTIFTMACSPRKNNKDTGTRSGGGGWYVKVATPHSTGKQQNNNQRSLPRRC